MNTNISDDKVLKIIIEILKYKIQTVADFHQIPWKDAKDLVLDELHKEICL